VDLFGSFHKELAAGDHVRRLRPQQQSALPLGACGGPHAPSVLACVAPDSQGFVVPPVRPVE
jgi:hypothetical protein